MSVATAKRLEAWFRGRRVFFGPQHGVCLDSDVFASERWYLTALFKMLDEAGIHPSSSDLIAAGRRARSNLLTLCYPAKTPDNAINQTNGGLTDENAHHADVKRLTLS